MDMYANKKIKITKSSVDSKEKLFLSEKHLKKPEWIPSKQSCLNKRFYTTNSNNPNPHQNFKTKDKDKLEKNIYLSYITPLKARKSKAVSKVIDIQDKQKKPFSVTDIETMGYHGKEIPVSISVKTANTLKFFIINHNLLNIDVEQAIKEL
jgi:hypothetical protein